MHIVLHFPSIYFLLRQSLFKASLGILIKILSCAICTCILWFLCFSCTVFAYRIWYSHLHSYLRLFSSKHLQCLQDRTSLNYQIETLSMFKTPTIIQGRYFSLIELSLFSQKFNSRPQPLCLEVTVVHLGETFQYQSKIRKSICTDLVLFCSLDGC